MTSQDCPDVLKNLPKNASKIPDLRCGAQFHITAANLYEVAQHAFKVCPLAEKLIGRQRQAELSTWGSSLCADLSLRLCPPCLVASRTGSQTIYSPDDQYLPTQRLLREGKTPFN